MSTRKTYVHFKLPKNLDSSLTKLKSKKASYWEKLGAKRAIKLANFALFRVPAYRKFLKDNNTRLKNITTLAGFGSLPLIDKSNYLRNYAYKSLFPVGTMKQITTISSTSGSTGEPFYFPREEQHDNQYEYIAEMFLKNQFEIDKKSTLGIIGFGLGIWIGGIYTYKNFNKIAQKGYSLALAPVGTNKEIFLKTFKKQADMFDQIILMGYPPFIKDVIDEAKDYGIDWKKYEIKIFTATEGFSERFRSYLANKAGVKNIYKDILNVYGSVELGTMSHETPMANLIRKFAVENKIVYKAVFGEAELLPTLVQYYPHIVYFEDVEGEVIGTGYASSFPLVRYKFHDRGGVIGFEEMIKRLSGVGVDIIKEAKKAKIEDTIMRLPFVYVYERSDFAVIIRGANIYPENIKTSLQDASLEDVVTGRFVISRTEDRNHNERLKVNVEMKKGTNKSTKLVENIREVVVKNLLRQNSEYNYLYGIEGREKLLPVIVLSDYEDSRYFDRNVIKQKWVKK